ncbi:hypothetical protein [Oceanospirillum sanctuarii]|uniref:hypothetical protein n=1 Tax=Oceanospirillum sanctuarii TaxID=1434821 RepID=UPI000A369966|nr:hypothetical protein [Oceanospirillum sanctuarii]
MVLSTLALVGIIQLFLLLAGGIFFLFLHTRFLKKQIRELRGETSPETEDVPPPMTAMTEGSEAAPEENINTDQVDAGELDPEKVTGEISELRKMLDEKLLLTANLRKLIEALEQNPDSAPEVAEQQKSSLLHLEEYIKMSRKEGAAVEEKITHYREQLAKAKKLLNRYKEQHEHDVKQIETEQKTDGQKADSAPEAAVSENTDAPKSE